MVTIVLMFHLRLLIIQLQFIVLRFDFTSILTWIAVIVVIKVDSYFFYLQTIKYFASIFNKSIQIHITFSGSLYFEGWCWTKSQRCFHELMQVLYQSNSSLASSSYSQIIKDILSPSKTKLPLKKTRSWFSQISVGLMHFLLVLHLPQGRWRRSQLCLGESDLDKTPVSLICASRKTKKTVHFQPLPIMMESSRVGSRWIKVNDQLAADMINFAALHSVKRSLHFAAGSSLVTNTSGFSVVRSSAPTTCIREKEREEGGREGGMEGGCGGCGGTARVRGGGGVLWGAVFPSFHQCECSMRRADNEAHSPAPGAIRMQSGGFHVIPINN